MHAVTTEGCQHAAPQETMQGGCSHLFDEKRIAKPGTKPQSVPFILSTRQKIA